MGTGLDIAVLPEQQGVIPRAVHQIFSHMDILRNEAIARNEPPPQFEITAQFLEVCVCVSLYRGFFCGGREF